MNPEDKSTSLGIALFFIAPCLALMLCAGCAFTIIPPENVIIPAASGAPETVVRYPLRVVTHHSESFWDLHQVKRNVQGLMDTQYVRIIDVLADSIIPAHEVRPLESAVEAIKNGWATLPDRAPFRVVGSLFRALGIEKLSFNRGLFHFPRLVYLTDWIQRGLGEVNQAAGIIIPGSDRLIPQSITSPLNRKVDSAQKGLIGAYIYVLETIDIGLDSMIDGAEAAWSGVVWVCAWPFYRNADGIAADERTVEWSADAREPAAISAAYIKP